MQTHRNGLFICTSLVLAAASFVASLLMWQAAIFTNQVRATQHLSVKIHNITQLFKSCNLSLLANFVARFQLVRSVGGFCTGWQLQIRCWQLDHPSSTGRHLTPCNGEFEGRSTCTALSYQIYDGLVPPPT